MLEGGPGWEYVRAKFTYQNTTDQPLQDVKVMLAVLNDSGEQVAASRVELNHPWGFPLMPGTLYSDEVSVATLGAHLDDKGWHWQVTCEATPAQGEVTPPPTGGAPATGRAF